MAAGDGGLAAPWTQPSGPLLWAECSRRRGGANASGRNGLLTRRLIPDHLGRRDDGWSKAPASRSPLLRLPGCERGGLLNEYASARVGRSQAQHKAYKLPVVPS